MQRGASFIPRLNKVNLSRTSMRQRPLRPAPMLHCSSATPATQATRAELITAAMNGFNVLLRIAVSAMALQGLLTHAGDAGGAAPAAQVLAPGVYIIPGEPGDIAPANLGRV